MVVKMVVKPIAKLSEEGLLSSRPCIAMAAVARRRLPAWAQKGRGRRHRRRQSRRHAFLVAREYGIPAVGDR
jgi:hypothetical protein